MSRGRSTARRLLQSILAGQWAIQPEWLNSFAGIASRLERDGDSITADQVRREIREGLATLREGRAETPSALAFGYGSPLGEGTRASVRDGVAIIPVMGPIYHYADEMHDVCGCSSYAQISADIAAVRDAKARGLVHAVLLEVDSPGGEVGGCAEAADLVAELAAELPMTTYVPDLGCSAAYWLAVASGRVVIASTARLGSIGVVSAYRRKDEKTALIEIVSSQSPKKRPDVETDSGRAQVQAMLNALADVFIADVAKHRATDIVTVASQFGQGDVLVGELAVAAGMADAVGSFESVLKELSGREFSRAASRTSASAGGGSPSMAEEHMPDENKPAAQQPPVINRTYLNANHADLVEAIREEGRGEARSAAQQEKDKAVTDAVAGERSRISAIRAKAQPGQEKIVAELVDSGATLEVAFGRLLDDQTERRQKRGLALVEDEKDVKDLPATGSEEGAPIGAKKPALVEAQERAAALRKQDPKLSAAAAEAQVFSQDHDLYARYLEERKGSRAG